MDYWKVIADEMKAEGWSVGWNTVATANVVLWSAEANRGGGNRYIARAEMAGCSRPNVPKNIAFQTEKITYSGDLEKIPAAPRIVAIRSKDSPYVGIIYDSLKIDLKPFTERGTLLVYSESQTVTRIQEQQDGTEVWVYTENRRSEIPDLEPDPPKHVLGVAIIPHSSKPIYCVDKVQITEN